MNSENFLLDAGIWGFVYKILTPIEWLMTWVMWVFHKLFTFIGMPEHGISWALAIIFLVIVVQACVFPLYYKSMKGMRAMQAMQPKMMKIQNKYKGKNDPASKEAMQREMMKLYKDNNANPAGSCLPMLLQGPVFMCMFYVLSAIPYIARGKRSPLGAFDVATAESFSQSTYFGVKITDSFTTATTTGKVVIGIFVALMCACLWYMQFYSMRRNTAPASVNRQSQMMQKAMLWVFPDHVHLLRRGHAFRRAHLLAREQHLQPAAHHVAGARISHAGQPAAEAKEIRDHDNENKKREKEGRPSLEEEELIKAKQEAESRVTQGFQREQPKRKNRGRKK